eukprot:211477-Rhodomonas_salina.1
MVRTLELAPHRKRHKVAWQILRDANVSQNFLNATRCSPTVFNFGYDVNTLKVFMHGMEAISLGAAAQNASQKKEWVLSEYHTAPEEKQPERKRKACELDGM